MSDYNQEIDKSYLKYIIGSAYPLNEVDHFLIPLKKGIEYVMEDTYRRPKLTPDRIMNILRFILTHPDILSYVEEAMEKEKRQILGISDEAVVMENITNEDEGSAEEGELPDTPNKNSTPKNAEIHMRNVYENSKPYNNLTNETTSDLKIAKSPGCRKLLTNKIRSPERNRRCKAIMEREKVTSTNNKRTSAEKEAKTQYENQGVTDRRNRNSADRITKGNKINEDKNYRSSLDKDDKCNTGKENRPFSNEEATTSRVRRGKTSVSEERKITEKRNITDFKKKKRTSIESDDEHYSNAKRKKTSPVYNVKSSYNKYKYKSPRKICFSSRHSSYSISASRVRSRSSSSRQKHEHVHKKSIKKTSRSPQKESSKERSELPSLRDLDEFQKANKKTYIAKVKSPQKSNNLGKTSCQNQKRPISKIEDKSDEKTAPKKIKPCEQNDIDDKEKNIEEGELEDEDCKEDNDDVRSSINMDIETNNQVKNKKIDISLENITSDDATEIDNSLTSCSIKVTSIKSPLVLSENKFIEINARSNTLVPSKIHPNHDEILQTDLAATASPTVATTPKHNIRLSATEVSKESPKSGLKEKQKCRKKKPLTYYISCEVKSPLHTTLASNLEASTKVVEEQEVQNVKSSPKPLNNEKDVFKSIDDEKMTLSPNDSQQSPSKPSTLDTLATTDDVNLVSDQLHKSESCEEVKSVDVTIPLTPKGDKNAVMLPDSFVKSQKMANLLSASTLREDILIDNYKLVDYDILNYESLELSPKLDTCKSQVKEITELSSLNKHRRKSPSPMKHEPEKVFKSWRVKYEEPKPFKSLYTQRMEKKIKALKEIESAELSPKPPCKEQETAIVKKKKKKHINEFFKGDPKDKKSVKNLTCENSVSINSSLENPSLTLSNASNVNSCQKPDLLASQNIQSENLPEEKSITKSVSEDSDLHVPCELSCNEMPALHSPEKKSTRDLPTNNFPISSIDASPSKSLHDISVINTPPEAIALNSPDETPSENLIENVIAADSSLKNCDVNLPENVSNKDSSNEICVLDSTSPNPVPSLINEVSELNSSSEMFLISPIKTSVSQSLEKVSHTNTSNDVPVEKSPIKVISETLRNETSTNDSQGQVPSSDSFHEVTPSCFSNEMNTLPNEVIKSTSESPCTSDTTAISTTKNTSNSYGEAAVMDSSSTVDNSDSPRKDSSTYLPNEKCATISQNKSPGKKLEKDLSEKAENLEEKEKTIWTKAEDREILSTCKTYGPSQISFQMVANALSSNKTPEQIKTRFEYLMELFKRKMLQKATKTQ